MNTLHIFVSLVLCIYQLPQCFGLKDLIVDLPDLGKIQGIADETAWTKRSIYNFLNVKFAESPSGQRRFQAPTTVQPWTGVRDSTKYGAACPSWYNVSDAIARYRNGEDIEDCLSLAISSPNLTGSNPVMVYIHGNFLFDGSAQESSPKYLLEKDVVLISVQYRVGPLGFLSTLSNDIPGNAGVLDVILALQWIQKYISFFGGDNKRITLFGQYGGAALVHVLTISPLVPENLFHQVIYQSGSSLTPNFITNAPEKFAQILAEEAQCQLTQFVENINECFRSMPAPIILRAYEIYWNDRYQTVEDHGGNKFVVGGPSGVLPDFPENRIQNETLPHYPIMAGVVKHAGLQNFEGLYEFNLTQEDGGGETNIKRMIAYLSSKGQEEFWFNLAKEEIFMENELNNSSFVELAAGLADLNGLISSKYPTLQAVKANLRFMPNQIFLYAFNYKGKYHRVQELPNLAGNQLPYPPSVGVGLSDENLYIFPWPEHAAELDENDTKIAKIMVDLWTSFARNGIPMSTEIPDWLPLENTSGPYLRIDEDIEIGDRFEEEFSVGIKDERNGKRLFSGGF